MRVDYRVQAEDASERMFSEWVCFEHARGSRAFQRAVGWWRARSRASFPISTYHAVAAARRGDVALPVSIAVEKRPGEAFAWVVDCEIRGGSRSARAVGGRGAARAGGAR